MDGKLVAHKIFKFGQSANVTVTLDAGELNQGVYNSYLLIDTNVEDLAIPIILTVNDEPQIPGDINNDGNVNVQDIVVIVNDYILEGVYNDIGDLNEDGMLNVLDVIILVNLILG